MPERGRSLVAPALLIECNSGLVAVLELDGEPSAAVRAFDDAEPRSNDPVTAEGADDDGRPWVVTHLSSAGGHYLEALAVPGYDGSSTVLITECGN